MLIQRHDPPEWALPVNTKVIPVEPDEFVPGFSIGMIIFLTVELF